MVAPTQRFVDAAASFSQCGIRVSVDIYDEPEPWTGSGSATSVKFPARTQRDHNYDTIMHRAPANGTERYAGIYSGYQKTGARIYFPIWPSNDPDDPWEMLQMHEWLHHVVSHHDQIAQGWPREDVHGASLYPPHSGMVDPGYFAEMMSGRVTEPDGTRRGILPHEWTLPSAPRNPMHQEAVLNVGFGGERRDKVYAGLHELMNSGETGTVTLTNLRTNHVTTWTATNDSRLRKVPPGRYRICLSWQGSERWLPAKRCKTGTIIGNAHDLITFHRGKFANGRAALRLRATGPAVGQKIKLDWAVRKDCAAMTCPRKTLSQRVRLRPHTTVRSPRVPFAPNDVHVAARVTFVDQNRGRWAANEIVQWSRG